MNDLSPAAPSPLLIVSDLAKRYGDAFVFSDVSLVMARGELVALLGESGVGKSTLLNCIAGLDSADAGGVTLAGRNVLGLSEPEAARLRREDLGFVFQAFHVLPHLSVADNVGLPLQLLGRPRGDRVARMLAAVGLDGLGRARAAPALGRAVATRGDRAGAGARAGPGARRRAHRQPRPAQRGPGDGRAGGRGPAHRARAC